MSGPISEPWDGRLPENERIGGRPWNGDWLELPPYLRPVTLGSLNQRLLRVERILLAMPDYPGDDE